MNLTSPLFSAAAVMASGLGALMIPQSAAAAGTTTLEAIESASRAISNKPDSAKTVNELLVSRGLPSVFPTPHQLTPGDKLVEIKDVQYIEDKELPLEAYEITLGEDGIIIVKSYTEVGKFYANQTISQLLGNTEAHVAVRSLDIKGKKLPTFHMVDGPDIPMRGVVEGFYGQPWSHEARLAQLTFYGRNKLNTYIYGPKDDPYHSANWREPYPAEEGKKITELVVQARLNHVKFYWSIHPGHNIKWTPEDMGNVIKKLEMMYELGVRDFAVFFDDIGGEGTNPEMQAKLMQLILSDFVDKKTDVGELIMCPTQYNRGWSGGDYLPLLGRELDHRVHIMWTGDTVVADINMPGQEWINEKLQRPAFIWWNSPTTDYVRDHLCLGRVYGLDQSPAMREAMSGFTSNPMDKPEASKIALFGVADYCWNVVDSNSQFSWLAGITRQFGQFGPAMMMFAEHNSDTGENYHKYRREESVNIAPAVEEMMQGVQQGKVSKEAWSKVSLEFSGLTSACKNLMTCTLPAVNEIRDWVLAGKNLGVAGENILFTVHPQSDGSISSNLDFQLPYFVRTTKALTNMLVLDKTVNQNQYQPGIKVGSLVLTPMVNELTARFDELYMQHITKSQKSNMRSSALPQATSSIEGLEELEIMTDKGNLGIRPMLEVHSLPAGGTIELKLPNKPMASRAVINLEDAYLPDWIKVEMRDADGNLHELDMKHRHHDRELVYEGDSKDKKPCAGLVLTNISDTAKDIKLTRVSLDVEQKVSYSDEESIHDGKLRTTLLITPQMLGKAIELPCPEGAKEVVIIGSFTGTVSGLTKKAKDIKLVDEEVQLRFDIKKGAKTMSITPSSVGTINEVIFL